jgi:hypothetical protein
MQTNMMEVIEHAFELTEKVSSDIQASNTAQEVTCFHTSSFCAGNSRHFTEYDKTIHRTIQHYCVAEDVARRKH